MKIELGDYLVNHVTHDAGRVISAPDNAEHAQSCMVDSAQHGGPIVVCLAPGWHHVSHDADDSIDYGLD